MPCKRTLTIESIQCLAIDERKEEGEHAKSAEVFCRFLVNTSILDPRTQYRPETKDERENGKFGENLSTHFITRSIEDVLLLSNRLITTFDVLLSRSRGGPSPLTRKSLSLPRSSRKHGTKSTPNGSSSLARQFLGTFFARQSPSNDVTINRSRSNSKSNEVWDSMDQLEIQQDRLSKSRKKAIDDFFQKALRIGGEMIASSRAMQDFFLKRKNSNQSNRSLYPSSTINSSLLDYDQSQTATITSKFSLEEDENRYGEDGGESICESTTSSKDGRSCRLAISNSHMALLHAEDIHEVENKNRKARYKEDDEIETVGEEEREESECINLDSSPSRKPRLFFNIKNTRRAKTANGVRENDFFGERTNRRCNSSSSLSNSLNEDGSSKLAKSRNGSEKKIFYTNHSVDQLIIPCPRVSSLQQYQNIPLLFVRPPPPPKITNEIIQMVQSPKRNQKMDKMRCLPDCPDEREWSSQDSCVDPICAPSPSFTETKRQFSSLSYYGV